jgi:hypothetical protein
MSTNLFNKGWIPENLKMNPSNLDEIYLLWLLLFQSARKI